MTYFARIEWTGWTAGFYWEYGKRVLPQNCAPVLRKLLRNNRWDADSFLRNWGPAGVSITKIENECGGES